jgi:outer membrane protein
MTTANRLATCVACLFALVAVVVSPTAARAADVKPIGIVDTQRIVKEYSAARDAQEQVQKFVRNLEKEIGDKEKELQRMMEEIDSQKMLLGEAALAAKMQEFETKRASYFEFREGADAKAEQEYKTRIGPIVDQVRTIAERLGKEDGYALVLDAASLTTLYIDSSVDLTDKVLAALVTGK